MILERVSKKGTRLGLHIRLTYGLHIIEIENWNEDQGGESRVKAAVIEDKSAVHFRSYGADYGAHKARQHTVAEAVLSRNGTEPRGKRQAVYIRLGRQSPRNGSARRLADKHHQYKEGDVAQRDGKDVLYMLSVRRKGQGCEDNSCGCPRKANARGQPRENLGKHEDEIEIDKYSGAVNGNIYHREGHTEFIREIHSVTRAVKQVAIAPHTLSVKDKSRRKGQGKQDYEKDVHKSAVAVGEGVICIICDGQIPRLLHPEGAIHKGMEENAENADGESRLIEAVTAVHRRRSGQERGNYEADCQPAHKGKHHTHPVYANHGGVVIFHSVSE